MILSTRYIIFWFVCMLVMFFLGFFLGRHYQDKKERKVSGSLIVNYDDPFKELLTLKLDIGLDKLECNNYILIKTIIEKDQNSDPKNSRRENS